MNNAGGPLKTKKVLSPGNLDILLSQEFFAV